MTRAPVAGEGHRTFGWRAWVALGTALALASTALATAVEYNTYDEAWFLHVVDRVLSGDALYRDVFYSPLPLAVYLTAALAALTTVHAFVVDAVLVSSATASGLLVACAALRLGCTRSAATAAAIGTLLVSPPQNTAPYGALAGAFAVGSLAVLVGRQPMTAARAAAAGALVGLTFASKQNVGGLASLAALIGVLVAGGRLREIAALVGAAATTVLLLLLPVAVQGGLGALLETGFAHKGAYLESASVSYVDTLRTAYGALRSGGVFESPLVWVWASLPALLPVLATVALAVALTLGRDDRRGLVVAGVYGLAAFAGAYPRMDAVHLGAAAPCLVVVVAGSWAQLSRRIGRRVDDLALAVTAVATAAFVIATVRAADQFTVSSLPHLEGVRLPPGVEHLGRRWRSSLAQGSAIFVVRQDAGFAYLVSGATDPTRFDYPATTNIGPAELREIRRGVEDGTIPDACIGGPGGFLKPRAVDALVRQTMTLVRSTGLCDVYRRRARRQS